MSESKSRLTTGLYALVCVVVVAMDQALKTWVRANIPLNPAPADCVPLIPGVIHLTHIHNSGVAFGLFQGGRWAFLALLAAFCGLVIWALHKNKLTAPWERWLAVLAMAGALGNGVDRAVYGYVVDMLEVEFMNFWVFNLADCIINVSAVLFVLLTLLPEKKSRAT